MQSESQESAGAPPLAAVPARSKYRVRFQKAGDLRLVSHHDLMHCFERMLRRAALPVPTTQGFNPRPRLWFAQSLALGVVGLNEVLELELSEPLAADALHRRLADQCPPGLAIRSVKPIDPRRPRMFAAPISVCRWPSRSPTWPSACAALLAQEHHWIERTRPQRRRLDMRPFVGALTGHPDGLEMALWVTPYGAIRPDEVAAALGLAALLEAGAVLERTDLELTDEATDATPLPAGLPLRPTTEETRTEDNGDSTVERTGAARPTALDHRAAVVRLINERHP